MQSSTKVLKKKARGPRDLGVSAVEDLLALGPPELLLPAMRCSFCKGTSAPEAFTCDKGHVVCSKCRSNVNECPFYVDANSPNSNICGASYRSRTNPLYRAVYLQSRVMCTNPGCTAYLRGKAVPQHKRECVYTTTMTCPWRDNCGSKALQFPDAPRHLKTHGVLQYHSTRRIFTLCFDRGNDARGSVPSVLIKHKGDTLALMTNSFRGSHFIFLCNLKSMKEAKRTLHATVSVIGINGERMEYSGRVRCYGERRNLMTNFTCVHMSDQLLQSSFLHAYDKDQKMIVVQVLLHETTGWKVVKEEDEEVNLMGHVTLEFLPAPRPQEDDDDEDSSSGEDVPEEEVPEDVKQLRKVLEEYDSDSDDEKEEKEGDGDEIYTAFLKLLISSTTY